MNLLDFCSYLKKIQIKLLRKIKTNFLFGLSFFWPVKLIQILTDDNFYFQPKERGSTRVHALNNVNRVLQVLHQNNVSMFFHNFIVRFFNLFLHVNSELRE